MEAPKQLKAWRTRKGLTLHAAATLIGTDWGAYRAWERGDRKPRVDTAIRIQEVTGVKVETWADDVAVDPDDDETPSGTMKAAPVDPHPSTPPIKAAS